MRDIVLSQTDIVKRSSDIALFVNKFCREADVNNEDETDNWYYCIDTNIPLLPCFFKQLSDAFSAGYYQQALAKVCKDIGVLSDDGDKWVDKFSGYYICNISFDMGEGYDEAGYKIVSRELMEDDVTTKLMKVVIVDCIFSTHSTWHYRLRTQQHKS